jgi:hypothetical protein
MFIGGVQEPINQAGAALLHDPDGAVLLSIALQCGVPLDMIRGATTRNPPDLAAVPERGGDHDHKRMLRLRKSHFA